MIVKADGNPYATYESAKQQLSAKGLGDTHEVAGGPGGYFLQKKEEEQVTLQPGDYVSTQGMIEGQYHAVAEAFMAAGAEMGEYPNWSWASDQSVLPNFGWFGVGTYHGNGEFSGRQLTISQVLNATNAKGVGIEHEGQKMKRGGTEADTVRINGWKPGDILEGTEGRKTDRLLIVSVGDENILAKWDYGATGHYDRESGSVTLSCREWRKVGEAVRDGDEDAQATTIETLRLAQQRVNELAYELSIAQGVRDEALESVRAELGEGFEISVVDGVPTGVDMSDPANWRVGDIVVAVVPGTDIHVGRQYVVEMDEDGCAGFKDSAGYFRQLLDRVKFHSRPTK